MNRILIALGLTVVFAVLVLAPASEVEQIEADLYAEMVCLGISTNMDLGWPNYKNLNLDCGDYAE
jgi:hypothetical protein